MKQGKSDVIEEREQLTRKGDYRKNAKIKKFKKRRKFKNWHWEMNIALQHHCKK